MVFEQCIGFLETPPLWVNEQFNMVQFEFPLIDLEGFKPKPIPSKIRLGHQMEYVFKQLLEFSDTYEVLLHNLPIKDGKRTIGEIDFILKNLETQKLIHVELTYKFYIINPDISEPIHQLMGPNKRDMFFTKMEKIKNEQFSLLHTAQGTEALQALGLKVNEIEHQTCYKGQLFAPYNAEKVHIRPLNRKCIVGYWLKFTAFKTEEFKAYQYYIPFKSQWVIKPHDRVPWSSHYETLLDINLRMLKESAPMIWVKRDDGSIYKMFVVWW